MLRLRLLFLTTFCPNQELQMVLKMIYYSMRKKNLIPTFTKPQSSSGCLAFSTKGILYNYTHKSQSSLMLLYGKKLSE